MGGKTTNKAIFLLVAAGVVFAINAAVVDRAEDIAYRFAPTYTPMTREEMLSLYPGYYWEGCTDSERRDPMRSCGFDEMQHESSVMIVDLKEAARRASFEQTYVRENESLIKLLANVVLWAVLAFVGIRLAFLAYSSRDSIFGCIKPLIDLLPAKSMLGKLKVKLAEIEHEKIMRLHKNGLLSDEEYERRKGLLREAIEENLG